jgi:hypothetical protein
MASWTPKAEIADTNGVTDVTAVDPAASTVSNVQHVSFENKDTVSTVFYAKVTRGAVSVIILKKTVSTATVVSANSVNVNLDGDEGDQLDMYA